MEAARRAISSPLLEGASVNGSRGVIINVTGGPDLSLVEVSEASLIVQEAAHEDANIIFGAVVDPALKGRVKITVIATGFGAPAIARSLSPSVQTPVDMAMYADHARMRADAGAQAAVAVAASVTPLPGVERGATPRLSIARRGLADLPLSAAPGSSDGPRTPQNHVDVEAESPFDVPAFLRRQEG